MTAVERPRPRLAQPAAPSAAPLPRQRRRTLGIDPEGMLTFLAIRPLSDLFLWAWRLERRAEYRYRPWFDRWLRPPLFAALQGLQNARRPDEHLAIAAERELPDEEQLIQDIIDELVAFTRENWLPGGAQRFGNTKTFGVLRGELTVLPGLPERLRHGIFAEPRPFPAWVRFSGPGPYAPPDLEDYGQCSVGIKVMGVPGPKLIEDEQETQDLILVSPASFVTPEHPGERQAPAVGAGQGAARATPINPGDTHLLHLAMQLLYSPIHANPLEVQYYSNVPFLLGDGQAVQYSLQARAARPYADPGQPRRELPPRRDGRAPWRAGDWAFDLMVQVQTDPHRMPIEDATVKWPERLSPYVPVARLRLPAQRFDSDAQLAFADALRYNPWHSLPEHRPLGNSNRARRRMYTELAALRQRMNATAHVEPTGAETFPVR